jgi:mono/diheme cytochrome c family protein
MTRNWLFLCFLMLLMKAGVSDNQVDFVKDIEPIFKEHCIKCHGPEKTKAELRIDQRVSLLKGGDTGFPSLVPGDIEKSYLIEVISGVDEEMRMPPKGELLSQTQFNLIKKWVEQGADWPGQMTEKVKALSTDHWSFQKIEKSKVPEAELHPIDSFILSKLKEHGLKMSEPADAKSLIKRVSVITTGLLPEYEDVISFEKAYTNNADKAYKTLVNQLLASPHFGERWAQHWMDVIRWAETNGSESNLYRKNAWMYRDYLVDAFNQDKPYDQFIKEQLAGDTMGEGEALGFLVAGPHVPPATVGKEPSAIRQARADRMDEIMQTVGASMMGVTVSCARCHNHKFDPMTIKDYYAMTAVFQDIEFGSRQPELKSNDPVMVRAMTLQGKIDQQRKELLEQGPFVEKWLGYEELHVQPVKTQKIRLDFINPSYSIDEIEVFAAHNKNLDMAMSKRGTKIEVPKSMNAGRTGATIMMDGQYGTQSYRAKSPKKSKERPWIELSFKFPIKFERLRLSVNREYAIETDYMKGYQTRDVSPYKVSVLDKTGQWKQLANSKMLTQIKGVRGEKINQLQSNVDKMLSEGPQYSFAARLIDPVETRVLHRGSPENPKDVVMPAGPVILKGDLKLTSESPGQKRRTEFAKWLVDKSNPLTPRVMVNRLWHHIFGAGIVRTTSDFGLAGAQPTHPELLDWLAHEFMYPSIMSKKEWGIKDMIRFMLMSKTFRQSSLPDDKGLEIDAGAQFLWRFPPRRVEAEVIRDGVLLASASLDKSIGGKSYRIHNVKKTYSQWEVVDNYGDQTWRRMLYQERMRRVDDKMFTAFDFPDCGTVRDKRPVSTTPLQALNLMNSQFIVDQAKLIAKRSRDQAESDEEILKRCFESILKRQPEQDEIKSGILLMKQAGLEIVCRSLLNSNEFAFLP